MRATRIIAAAILVVASSTGITSAQALRDAGPPAEFPPASYKGKQYVDSRGCMYIRAGIDGNVTWVPRVNRQRQLICGQRPSLSPSQLAGAAPRPQTAPEAVEITLAPQDRRAAPTTAAPAPRAERPTPSQGPAPTVFGGAPKSDAAPSAAPAPAPTPRRTAAARPARKPSPAPAPTVFGGASAAKPAPATAPAPRRSAKVKPGRNPSPSPSPGPAPTVFGGKPVAKPAATQKPARAVLRKAAPVQSDTARIVRRHIDENRQNARNVSIPPGYRAVWTDGRLNPHRAERTAAPSVTAARAAVPRGYRAAWEDQRLNPGRARGSAAGDAATDAIWTRELPRRLAPAPSRGAPAKAQVTARNGRSPYWTPPAAAAAPVARLSTRSAPALASKPRYVRVAVYGSDAGARAAAVALAKSGLPIRLGTLHRGNERSRVVLAGPFTSDAAARAALKRLHQSGHSGARLSR